MNNIDYYLGLEYEELKDYLLYAASNEERQSILSDSRIKRKLILPENRHELTWLCNDDKNGIILPLLLDSEGIDLLQESEYISDSILGILAGNSKAVEGILSNDKMEELLFQNIENLKYSFSILTSKSAESIVKYAVEHNQNIGSFIGRFEDDITVELLKHLKLSRDETKSFLPVLKPESMKYLMETTIYRDILGDYNYYELKNIFSNEVVIPIDMIRDKRFLKGISTIYDPKIYRFLVNSISNPSDKDIIEAERKKYYEEQIYGYDSELGMTPNLKEVYLEIVDIANKEGNLEELYSKVTDIIMGINYFKKDSSPAYRYYEDVIGFIKAKDLNGLTSFFQKQSNALLTDMIIDYSFEDVYSNVLKNMEQLVNFSRQTTGVLDEEKKDIYSKILDLDTLPYDEKIALFDRLKSKDFVEEFYDDYLSGRTRFEELLNESILNEESIKKYRHPASDAYGVDIYVLDGDPFYGLIKSLRRPKDSIMDSDTIKYGEATSLSVISSEKLSTFYDPREYYNVIYSSMPGKQMIHAYPVDSFTGRGHEDGGRFPSSDRVNQLMTPEKFVKASSDYSEILAAQKPKKVKKDDEVGERLQNIPILGILCYDSITNFDIESAKNLGCSVVCVMTKKYTPYTNDSQISMHDRTAMFDEKADKYLYTTDSNYNPSIDREHKTR